jgi:hypothetical protein
MCKYTQSPPYVATPLYQLMHQLSRRYSTIEDRIEQHFALEDISALEHDPSDPMSLVIGLTTATDESRTSLGHRRAASESFLPQLLQTTQLYVCLIVPR